LKQYSGLPDLHEQCASHPAGAPPIGRVESHQPSPASQHESFGSSSERRSDLMAVKSADANAAFNRASAFSSRPPMQGMMPVLEAKRAS
jgi:hypothetical protein